MQTPTDSEQGLRTTTQRPGRLHLIDGTYELYRAHYSRRPPHEVGGRDLKATVGIASSLLALLHDPAEAVSHLAIAFDNPIRSFRNDLYADYKSDEGVPSELRSQFDLAEQAALAVGVTVWSMAKYEADDALATAAARFRDQVDQVRILTPDKDLGQMISGQRVVQVDRMRNRLIDEEELFSQRGLRPDGIPDWLALMGDTADGFPGLAGFGAKTAAALVRAFGHLEQIPMDPARWPAEIRGAGRLAETLAEEMENALLYRKLATLVSDVPLAESLQDLAWAGVPKRAFAAWCQEVGARDLLGRPARWAPP
jgi:5'-3' exonuclease